MRNLEALTALLGRIFLSFIFIKSGFGKLLDPASTAAYMTSKGIPLAGVLIFPTIAVLLGGGIALGLGWKTRLAALLLIGFLIPATVIFHTNFPEEEIAFWKNLGLMGGLLMTVAFGGGQFSLDSRWPVAWGRVK
jgi:putative oxidoreductase